MKMSRKTTIKSLIRQMNPASFQRMCYDYLEKIVFKDIVSLGTYAGAEKTTRGTPDSYISMPDGKYIYVEYTTQQNDVATKIEKDIEKCLDVNITGIPIDRIKEIICIHNSSNVSAKDDSALKEYCKAYGIQLEIIGIDSLAAGLDRYPSILLDHLNISIDTNQVQSMDEFIKRYDSNKTTAPLDTPFLFRETEMEQVTEMLSTVDAVLITAPAGTGKTRFALEYAKKYAHDNNGIVVCIHDLGQEIFNDLHMSFEDPGNYFVVFDDANQLSNLSAILETLYSCCVGHSYKILLTVRDYAVDKVEEALNKTVQYATISLKAMTDDQIKEMVQRYYGILNQKYLDRIAAIADGNPRLAMLAGRIAITENTLESIKDVTDLYDQYYGPALRDSGVENNKTNLICAGIVAFLGVLHLDQIKPIYDMLEGKGISSDQFISSVYDLHYAEVVDVYYDKAVKTSDQCLADYILKYVFFDYKLLSLKEMILVCLQPYHGRTIQALNTLSCKYQNDEMHSFLEDVINIAWNQLRDNDSALFWDFVKAFYPVKYNETLLILKEKIDNTSIVYLPVEDLDFSTGKNNVSIDDDIISILGGYRYYEDIDSALDLFFRYYLKRSDLYMQFYHASCSAYGIRKDSHEAGYYTQIHYIRKAIQYSDNWCNDYMLILFLEVAKEYLKLHFEPIENGRNERDIVIYQIPLLPSEAAFTYRNLIWEQLETIACKGSRLDQVKVLLKDYGYRMEEGCLDIVKNDAPHICSIIRAFLSPSNLQDCLIINGVAGRFTRAGVAVDDLGEYLSSDKMVRYRILTGPEHQKGVSYEEMRIKHRAEIVSLFHNAEDKTEAFYDLLEVFDELADSKYSANNGIYYALEELSSEFDGFLSVAADLMSRTRITGLPIPFIINTLFRVISVDEVKALILNSSSPNKDYWLFVYYQEMPPEAINDHIIQGLYTFLQEEKCQSSSETIIRGHRFLKKYFNVDSQAIVRAAGIIYSRRICFPALVNSYFYFLFIDAKEQKEVLEAFSSDITLLSDLYVFLFRKGLNSDHEGVYLNALQRADPGILGKLASAMVDMEKELTLRNTDNRFCVLYSTEQYAAKISVMVDRIVEQTEYPTITAPYTISCFLSVPEGSADMFEKPLAWLRFYIKRYAADEVKMRCIFITVANNRLDLMKDCVAEFIENNKDFKAFEKLTIMPTEYSSCGSFVPHYHKCIESLKTLLSLFSGSDFLQHRQLVEKEIEFYKNRIRDEEISNIITG